MLPELRKSLDFVPRLAAFYAALFILPGIAMPFFPVWLKAKDVDAKLIGILLAVPMVARMLAIPVITREADRRDAVRTVLLVASLATVAGYALVGLSSGVIAIFVTYALTSLFWTPLMPLAETYAFKGLMARKRAYGPVRLWGSFAFILGNFAAGFAADAIPARHLIWLMVAASALVALAAWALAPLATNAPEEAARAAPRQKLLRDPAFVAVLAAASLIQASHAVFYGFSAVQWHAAGLDGTYIAALWALGVAAEIVLFAVQARLPPFFTPTVLLMTGAAAGTVRWLGMAIDPPSACTAVATIAACIVIRRDPSRRADVSRASHTCGPGRNGAGLSCDRRRRGDGRRHGSIGRAVRRLRQPRLCGDGASGLRRRRLRTGSAPAVAPADALSASDSADCDRNWARCR